MRRLLIVDDERDICDFMKTFFQERGYDVTTASNGDEAISAVNKEKPHLAILDITMRGMDGLAALKHIKSIDKDLAVIMVTAHDDHERMNEAFRLGASAYITKPLVLENLEGTVEKYLRETLDPLAKGTM